jgi:hypothetical protein
MANLIQSFRSKMIVLFGLSMLLSGIIMFALYKILQYYYRTQVKFEDPLAYVRLFIRTVGDINFFLIFFIPLAVFFFLSAYKALCGLFQ